MPRDGKNPAGVPRGGEIMELIINHNGLKRKIVGAFELLAKPHTLRRIVAAIEAKRQGEDWDDVNYGWIEVHEALPVQANTSPINWEDAGEGEQE
jgi:hypothetical protein